MTFDQNLKRICESRGISPTSLLESMGVSTSKVTLWNKGGLPKQDMLVRLAKELNCSVMDFFADEEDLQEERIVRNADEQDILRIFRAMSRRQQHEFMTMVYSHEDDEK